jgi:hypothetical protein
MRAGDEGGSGALGGVGGRLPHAAKTRALPLPPPRPRTLAHLPSVATEKLTCFRASYLGGEGARGRECGGVARQAAAPLHEHGARPQAGPCVPPAQRPHWQVVAATLASDTAA